MQNEVERVHVAQLGDAEAFRRLVETYQQAVYVAVISIVSDEFHAQDLAQETFIRAYLNLDQLKDPNKIRAWLCGIARNVTLKWIARQRPLENIEENKYRTRLQSHIKSADEVIHRKQMHEQVLRGIYALPEAYREILFLFYMRGMKYTELADFLSISLAAVRNRLYKARKLLKEVLEKMATESNQDKSLPDDFTDRVIADAMRQGQAYLQQKHWEAAKKTFLRAVDVQEDYAPAYRGIGLALKGQVEQPDGPTEALKRPLLKKAIEELKRAFRLGDYTADTVWPLVQALEYISDMDTIIEVLKKYAAHAPDSEQEFSARHQVVIYYALLREHQEAVDQHTNLLQSMRSVISNDSLLWSFSNHTILGSWKEYGRLSEWMNVSNTLYSEIEDTYDTCVSRAYYLRALIEAVYVPSGELEVALATCDRLSTLAEKYMVPWVAARWIITDVYADRLSIYHKMQNKKLAYRTVTEGLRHLSAYESYLTQLSASEKDRKIDYKREESGKTEKRLLGELHQQHYQFALHDFA